ncbi:hypothetical protein TNCV_2258931 [Trichonephila clavipes]|nr:hypothetical protein TNCV_2258931 [Trichonephila clavipes]
MQSGEDVSVDENDIGHDYLVDITKHLEKIYTGAHTREDLSVPIVSTVMPRSRFRNAQKSSQRENTACPLISVERELKQRGYNDCLIY